MWGLTTRLLYSSIKSSQQSRAIAKMTARCAVHMDVLKNFGSPWLYAHGYFSQIVNGLPNSLQSIVLNCVQNLKFVALPVPAIIEGNPCFGQPAQPCPTWANGDGSWNPLLYQELVKLRTSNLANKYIHRIHQNKCPLNILEKRERGRIQGLHKVFKYPLLSQKRVKLQTSNLGGAFTGSVRTKVH